MIFIKVNEGAWPLRVPSELILHEEFWDQSCKLVINSS